MQQCVCMFHIRQTQPRPRLTPTCIHTFLTTCCVLLLLLVVASPLPCRPPLQVYDAGSGVLPLSPAAQRSAARLFESLDAGAAGWLRAARTLLETLSDWQDLLVTHVVVGHSQLVPLLAKLLLVRLDGSVGLTQVYSAAAVPKVAAFRRVRAKYGPRARYVVLGAGFEEEAAAGLLRWPFVRVLLGQEAAAAVEGQSGTRGAAEDDAAMQANTDAAAAGAGAGSSKAAAAGEGDGGGAAVKRHKRGSGSGSQQEGAGAAKRKSSSSDGGGSNGGAAAEAAADVDGEEDGEEGEKQQEGGGEQKGGAKGAAGKPAGERRVSPPAAAVGGGDASGVCRPLPLDALGSRGHTIMDLSADKLRALVMSMQLSRAD